MSDTTSVYIVDDHPMVIDGLSGYLDDTSRYHLIGSASNGPTALQQMADMEVDVVLTDIQMPGMDGVEFTKELLRKNPRQKVIALTMFNEPQYIKRMLQVGVMGYILKNCGKMEVQRAIDMVMSGGQYYSADVTDVIMNKLRGNHSTSGPVGGVTDLTEREKEILYLVLKQCSNQEIAAQLFISSRTVEAHKRNLLEKTGSKNIAGLVLYTIDNQLFDDF